MEKAYWLQRQSESREMARATTSAEAQLIHFDLAGRYSIEAANVDLETAAGPPEARSESEVETARPTTRFSRAGPSKSKRHAMRTPT